MVHDEAIASIAGFANLPVAIVVVQLDGTIFAANEAAEALLERPADQLVGRKVWELAPGMEHVWPELIGYARQHGSYRGEITAATPHQHRHITYVASVREHAGTAYVVGVGLEANSDGARNAQLDAKHRVEALALLAGGVAHAFNNQLVSVLAEASVSRENQDLDDAIKDGLRRIEAAGERMAQLTRKLLAYAGGGKFISELVDPDEIVAQSHEQITRSLRADVVVRVITSAGRIAVEADRTLLRKVIANLVANSAEALGDKGGMITIRTRLDGASWVLDVTDNGAGMDVHAKARMFDPFFTTKRDHHGLGLSAVHGIVRRLGGEIAADSEVGRGTVVSVRLPFVIGAKPQRARSRSTQPPLATLQATRILVADDEPTVLATVKRVLARRGAEVVLAADGAEARAQLDEGAFQILLFDVKMPELTGYQLLPFARQLQPSAKVILMSGYSERAHTPGIDEPDGFLEKPFTAAVLDAAIDGVLA